MAGNYKPSPNGRFMAWGLPWFTTFIWWKLDGPSFGQQNSLGNPISRMGFNNFKHHFLHFPRKNSTSEVRFLFNGDFVDRGTWGPEVQRLKRERLTPEDQSQKG